MPEIEIGNRRVGDDYPPFVIAEVGINHEGDVGKALQLVDAAVSAGADCVKFQCHITEKEMVPTDIKPGGISEERLWDIIKRCELTEGEERRVKAYCESSGILYLCTPFSREAADRLDDMGVLAFKIGSGECNNLPLVDHIAKKRKPIILSTGMNDLESVRRSVQVVQNHGTPLLVNHCTSMYPTPYEHVRLGAIVQLKETFKLPVGLSDHSMGIYTCLGAVALGACAVEKHFTITRSWPGPDVPISIEPDELAQLVIGARAIHAARGGLKTVLPQEQPVIDFACACVVAIRDIAKGEVLSLDNLWVKRPGTGKIPAADLDKVLGRRARRNLPKEAQLTQEDLA
jgi:N-acetylneuraminate synthase